MNEKVIISSMKMLAEDNRGITSELTLPKEHANFIYIRRNKNTISGNVYHEGKVPAMSPKILLLLSGEVKFTYRHIADSETISENIKAPAKIEIFPYIAHKIEAIEDFVILECYSKKDMDNDRIRFEV